MNIPWKEEYSLGIETIDTQHKKLIGIINEVAKAMEGDASEGAITQAVTEMRQYAEDHLAFEESVFEQCGYVETAEHRAEHDIFRETIEEFRERSKENGITVAIEMLGYLEGWLIKHILVTDKKYVEAFKAFGVK